MLKRMPQRPRFRRELAPVLCGNSLAAKQTFPNDRFPSRGPACCGLAVWYVNHKIELRKASFEREERILKSLEYLTGGTQSRSAGLQGCRAGVLEGMLTNNASDDSLRKIFLPV